MLCWETHPLRLNPISSSYPYPLFFDCPLAPQSKVTGGDGWNLPLRNETLILHQLTLIAFCKRHANSHFQDFVFSSGDYSCITAAMLALTQCHLTLTWWRCFPTPLHIIDQVIEYNITLLHYLATSDALQANIINLPWQTTLILQEPSQVQQLPAGLQ